MTPLQQDNSSHILFAALVKAKEWGCSFVIFVGAQATTYTGDKTNAVNTARKYRDDYGFKGVSIKRIRG